jgi:hypothetical protein
MYFTLVRNTKIPFGCRIFCLKKEKKMGVGVAF